MFPKKFSAACKYHGEFKQRDWWGIMGLTMINSSMTLTRAVLSRSSLAGTDRERIKDTEADSTAPFQETLQEGGKKGKAASGLTGIGSHALKWRTQDLFALWWEWASGKERPMP